MLNIPVRLFFSFLVIFIILPVTADINAIEYSEGWVILDSLREPLPGEYLFQRYSSFSTPYFVRDKLELKDFKEVKIEIFSQVKTTIELTVKNHSGNNFIAVRDLSGQKVNTLVLKPDDFISDPAETLFSKFLDSGSVRNSIEIYDSGTANAVLPRNNKLVIHSLTLVLPQMPEHKGILRISRDLEINQPWRINGDVIIEKDARLIVRNTAVQIAGRVILFGGELSVSRAEIRFLQDKINGQVINATRSGLVQLSDSRITSANPSEINISRNSRIFLDNVTGNGNLRYTIESGSRFYARGCSEIGEVRYDKDSRISVEDSRNVWIWLYAGANLSGDVSLPVKSSLREWYGDSLFPVRIVNTQEIKWGLRIFPGVRGFIRKGNLEGIEVVVPEGHEADFSGIRNNKLPPGNMLQPEYYHLRFQEQVKNKIWNFTAENGSSLVLRNCDVTEVKAYGNKTSLTLMNSEIGGTEGFLAVELGGSCFLQDSTLLGPLLIATGGRVRGFYSRINGSCYIGNGGQLTVRSVFATGFPEIFPGGVLNGKLELAGNTGEKGDLTVPFPVLSRFEVGGIGSFLPKISGLEDLENTVIPHFEAGILNRFFIRFPEFEYVLFRQGMPSFSKVFLKAGALFEHETSFIQKDYGPEESDREIYRTPLSFESIAGGSARIVGPVWLSGEIAADPSSQSYKGFRIYTEMEFLRSIPRMDLNARVYAGIQFGSEDYLRSYHSFIIDDLPVLSAEKVQYGTSVTRAVDENWTFNLSCSVENYVGKSALAVGEQQDPFDWSLILALIYHIW